MLLHSYIPFYALCLRAGNSHDEVTSTSSTPTIMIGHTSMWTISANADAFDISRKWQC